MAVQVDLVTKAVNKPLDPETARKLLGVKALKYTDIELQEIINALNNLSILIIKKMKKENLI